MTHARSRPRRRARPRRGRPAPRRAPTPGRARRGSRALARAGARLAAPAPAASASIVASDAEDEDPFGRQEALSQDRQGKLRGRRAYSSHILEKKSPKRKRRMARPVEIAERRPQAGQAAAAGKGGADEPRHQRRRPQAAQEEGPRSRPRATAGASTRATGSRNEQVMRSGALRLPRPPGAQARLPPALDHRGSTPPPGARA